MIAATLLRRKEEGDVWRAVALDGLPEQIPQQNQLLWVDLRHPTEQELSVLKRRFSLADGPVERVASGNDEPFVETYDTGAFVVVNVPTVEDNRTGMAPLYFFFGEGWVITVLPERPEALRAVEARIMKRGLVSSPSGRPTSDLIFLFFLDAAVDQYYPVSEVIDDGLERLDEGVVTTAKKVRSTDELLEVISSIGEIKKEMTTAINSLARTRDVVRTVVYGEVSFVRDENLDGFRRVYAHSIWVLRAVEGTRERARRIAERSRSSCSTPRATGS